jgi:hypothetical protein
MSNPTFIRFNEGNISISLNVEAIEQIINEGDDKNRNIKIKVSDGSAHYVIGIDADRVEKEYLDYLEFKRSQEGYWDWLES